MEGVTDAPMRALQTERGAFAFCISEFLRVSQNLLPARVFLKHVPELRDGCKTPSGVPVQVQLLGGDPDLLAQAALTAVELGAPAIDLNFGCPAPTVNRHDGGATLLKYPDRIRAIVSAVRNAVPREIPVSAKLRLGWDGIDAVHRNADEAAAGGANWITIHGRTRAAGYAPPIYWEPIGKVRERLSPLPVVANGDIWTLEDFKRCQDSTSCEHYMLGRGALADPNLSRNIAAQLGISGFAPEGTFGKATEDWMGLFERFHWHTRSHPLQSTFLARRIKQWAHMAQRHGGLDWFDEIKRLNSFEEIAAHIAAPTPRWATP